MLVVVSLVLLAAYVSAGRQFMPAISRYADFFEQQVLQATGLPVSVDSLQGSFIGFNPSVTVNGLSLLVDSELEASGNQSLRFDSASVIVDMPRTIWERQWVLEEFAVDNLSLDLEQQQDGSFLVRGINNTGAGDTDIDNLFQTFLRVSRLDLRNVEINVQLFDGDQFSLENGTATIQNLGNRHYVHVNANIAGQPELAFSLEITGSRLQNANGYLHVAVPRGDYSQLISGQQFDNVQISNLQGGADLWIEYRGGRVQRLIAQPDISLVTLRSDGVNSSSLEDISGRISLSRGVEEGQWQLLASDLTMRFGQDRWDPFNAYLYYVPGGSLSARASNINLTMLAGFAVASGLLPENLQSEISLFAPRGELENFSLYTPLGEENTEALVLRSNIASGAVNSVRGSPAMRGINGYAEAEFDPVQNRGGGFAEIESTEFAINIPNIFTTTWEYNYVNGRLGFGVDLANGSEVKLASSTIVAATDAITARVKFSNTIAVPEQGEREADLELLVGVQELDARYDYQFTPDGPKVAPNLYNSMEYLRGAIGGGHIINSGALFRGSTVEGSSPNAKTFQSFYHVEGGDFTFNPQWPGIQQLSALVVTDDNNIDIDARGGGSMGISLAGVAGTIRRDAEGDTHLQVAGNIAGATADGLAYLQAAPVGEAFKNTISTWQASGDFSGDLTVQLPMSQAGAQPNIHLDFQMADNRLQMPEFDLDVTSLNGPVIFDTLDGVEDSVLTGSLFGGDVRVNLSSEVNEGVLQTINVIGSGRTTPQAMIEWPRQNQFVRNLLAEMDGEFNYRASLSIEQGGSSEVRNRLSINSDLLGTTMNLPEPYTKSAQQPMNLNLQIDFGRQSQVITGSLGPATNFELELAGTELVNGLVVLGRRANPLLSLGSDNADGLVVTGRMSSFHVQQWVDFFAGMGAANSSADVGENIAYIDVDAAVFELYGQELPEVKMRIEPDVTAQGWLTRLTGDAVQGWVTIPFRSSDFLDIDLEYLRLPASEEEEELAPLDPDRVDASIAVVYEEEEERIDPLANVDPRALPAMHFRVGEFNIGERPFGNWKFTFNPTAEGAEISDLAFDFRGLRTGLEPVPPQLEQLVPGFTWNYDGENHHSYLTGVLLAANMADVLRANGIAPSLESSSASFVTRVDWPGSPAFFSGDNLSGSLDIAIDNGRFLQGSGGGGALKLISIINFSAIMRRARFSDDLLRRGLAFDEIRGEFELDDGIVTIQDQLVITGPSSLYQISGDVDLENETISGEMYLTLPVSDNIPWIGLLTGQLPLAIGAYLFDQIFGDQINSLTSAAYTLEGPWEGLEPQFKQAFGAPPSAAGATAPN